ncbi:MAG TPA: adenosylcobinamide-phosphate synthase CbiB [Thiobacillus sp.]|mgnify:FL=1|nr:adenosylcobinamide-phosphate synthase CbiB [Thiobacillus sp.]HQT32555.1 adenosylcobinamide-phosphate synthase CbiB [Thiobacillus sp.]
MGPNLSALLVAAALLLDALLGEPRRFHPLAGFGRLAAWLEARFNLDGRGHRLHGVAALALLVLPGVALAGWLQQQPGVGALFSALVLYAAIGLQSLHRHAEPVAAALARDDLDAARAGVSMMVSRDTTALDAEGVSRATVESVLENGNDAVFGALFWFLVAGAAGALGYRLVNTLDAMWGYKTPRYRQFGWAAARLDDGLNFVPARLTALSYALLGRTRVALACWRTQAPAWDSPNAGPVMAAGAGALGVRLGGAAVYHGRTEARPALGQGAAPQGGDIARALKLVRHGVLLWLGALAMAALLVWGVDHA